MAQHTLFTFFGLILLSVLSKQHSASLLNLYATKSGNITLGQDAGGFKVPIDFANYETEASDGTSSYDMELSLYSSQTFLASYYCLDFFGYYCQSYPGCQAYKSSSFSANYVQFSATGYMMAASVYLDYNNWYLDGRAGYATNCTSNVTLPYGNSRYGILGMGFANGGQDNYPGSRMFSLSLNTTLHSGSLIFHNGTSVQFPSYTPVATIQTNNNWNINTSAIITIGYSSVEFATTVIFDLNSDAIGFPVAIYDYVIKYLEKNTSMSCNNVTFSPVCSFTGNVLALPNITLNIQNQDIQIPPNIYVQEYYIYNNPSNTSSYSLTLNLRAISSNLLNDSYVSPAFNDFVILDQNFLLYYITLFNATGYSNNTFQVTLYAPPYSSNNNNNNNAPPTPVTPSSSSSGHKWIWIPIGIFCFAVLVIIIVSIVRSYRKKKATSLLAQYDGNVMGTEEPANQNYQNPDYPYNMQPQDYNPNQNYYHPQYQQYPSYGNQYNQNTTNYS